MVGCTFYAIIPKQRLTFSFNLINNKSLKGESIFSTNISLF